jgi:hypothetical protein
MKERVSLGRRACATALVDVDVTENIILQLFRFNSVLLGNSNLRILLAPCEPLFCGNILKWEVETPWSLLIKYETFGGSPELILFIYYHYIKKN